MNFPKQIGQTESKYGIRYTFKNSEPTHSISLISKHFWWIELWMNEKRKWSGQLFCTNHQWKLNNRSNLKQNIKSNTIFSLKNILAWISILFSICNEQIKNYYLIWVFRSTNKRYQRLYASLNRTRLLLRLRFRRVVCAWNDSKIHFQQQYQPRQRKKCTVYTKAWANRVTCNQIIGMDRLGNVLFSLWLTDANVKWTIFKYYNSCLES